MKWHGKKEDINFAKHIRKYFIDEMKKDYCLAFDDKGEITRTANNPDARFWIDNRKMEWRAMVWHHVRFVEGVNNGKSKKENI